MRLALCLVLFSLAGCAHSQQAPGPVLLDARQYLNRNGNVWVERGMLMANLGDPMGIIHGCIDVPGDDQRDLGAGKICLTRLPFDREMLKPGPRDGFVIRIDPANVPDAIKTLYVHLQPAGQEPLPSSNPCQWTREHDTCSFATPAGWGIGFAVTIGGPSEYIFYQGNLEIVLNGKGVATQTAFRGGPNNIRVYSTQERPILARGCGGALGGATPLTREFEFAQ